MKDIAIVIGGNHHNTLGVIRSLGRKGISSFVILHGGAADSYVLKSRYIIDYNVVPQVEDAIHVLLSKKKEGEKKVVICASDGAASVVDLHRNELVNYYWIPGCPDQGRLTQLQNKETMAQLAVLCNLTVPESIVIDKDTTVFDNLPFPCITKPISSIAGTKNDIAICKDSQDLKKLLARCKSKRIQVQKFIEKTMEYQLIGISYKGSILIPGRSRIITQPLETNTGFLHYEHLDGSEPIQNCLEFIKRAEYSGLFSMEFIRDKDGHDYFMEINFRNDGNAICVTAAGVNLPYLWYMANSNNESSALEKDIKINDIYVMPEYGEIGLWREQKISTARLIKDFRQTDVYMEYDREDPAPTNGKLDFYKRLFVTAFIRRPTRIILRKNKK